MNKDDFFDLVDRAKAHFARRDYSPKGIRLEFYSDPYDRNWKLWIVGPGSLDEGLVMAIDCYPIKGRFVSEERARKAHAKYKKWFAEWEEFQEWKDENSFE